MDTQAYENGKEALEAQDYKAAERAFKIALEAVDEGDEKHNNVQSYYGLVQVLNGDNNGLLLCRDAASNQISDGDVFLNLACAEWASGNRKRAIDAVQHGIKINAEHAQLNRACVKLDCRKRCCFSLLARSHKLNRLFGRLMRKPSERALTVHDLLF